MRKEDFQRTMDVTSVEYGTGVKENCIRAGIIDVFEHGGLLHRNLSLITIASTIIHKEWIIDHAEQTVSVLSIAKFVTEDQVAQMDEAWGISDLLHYLILDRFSCCFVLSTVLSFVICFLAC